MALGDPYCTLADITAYLNVQPTGTTKYDVRLTGAIMSASSEIEKHCGRQFNQQSTATARLYAPEDLQTVKVDDFVTQTGLVVAVDLGGIGVYDEVLLPQNVEVYPYSGVVDGQPGWPYSEIRVVGGLWFPPPFWYRRNASVQVTAQWGWPAVPAPVHQACLLIAAQLFRMPDAPLGVSGVSEFASPMTPISIKAIPIVQNLLSPYTRGLIMGG